MNDRPTRPPWSTDAWREQAGRSWLAKADRLEAMLAPVLEPLFDHAGLGEGECVFDIGCGRGATALRAAELVGATGSVLAVDVSSDLIAEASRLSADAGMQRAPITWEVGDAQRAQFGVDRFDAAISRFGVMFFDDPIEAFANVRRQMRPSGRLAVATWQPRDACDFQSVGVSSIIDALRSHDYEVPELDPNAGPYAFGVEDHLRQTLDHAGWREVRVHPVRLPLYCGGPGLSTAEAVDTALGVEGLKRLLAPYDQHAHDLAAEALTEAFAAHHDGTGVGLEAAIMVTTASAA